jgi:hypothetical protein
MTTRSWLGGLGLVLLLVAAGPAAESQWTPEQWTAVDTLQLCTTGPEEATYCFPVWLVVLDGDVYVRLGSKAAGRVKANTGGAVLPVEVAGHRFERVRVTEAPDQVERVNKAMADKYTSDILIRLFPHPLTLRLNPETAGS